MVLYTDDIRFAHRLIQDDLRWEPIKTRALEPSIRPIVEALVQADRVQRADVLLPSGWEHLVAVGRASDSQFDVLNRLARSSSPAADLLAIAGTGERFHGFKDRPWVAAPGNLHLCALVHPSSRIEHAGVAFTVLAAVSVLQSLDDVGNLHQPPAVKWVNDVMIGPAKVGGVLASAQIQDATVISATLGIGLNVEVTPVVPATPFVPQVGSVREFSLDPSQCSLSAVFHSLAAHLGTNYRSLLAGSLPRFLDLYRSRSLVLGRHVRVHRDRSGAMGEELRDGVVSSIGDDLQLFLDGAPSPIPTGRLELLPN